MTPRGKVICGLVLSLSAVVYLWWVTTGGSSDVLAQGDALVYRGGTRAWLDGQPVYTDKLNLELEAGGMFFTYGPLALVLFVPLSVVPISVGFASLAVVSLLALVGALAVWWRALGRSGSDAMLLGLGTTLAMGLSTPLLDHLRIGQVNTFLLLLASLDLMLPRTRWPRGLLVGLAIAIKLTPAALLLLPLLRRDVRTVVVAGCTAAVGIAASWIVVPREASYFWFTAFRDPGRIGNLRSPDNQSIRGITERWIEGPLGGALWLLGALVVVAWVSWMILARLLPAGDVTGAAAVVFCLPALLSPVAWTHHWVWAFPLLVWLLDRARVGSRGAAVLAASGLLVFWWFPVDAFDPAALIPGAPGWSAMQAALAGGFVYWAFAALASVPFLRRVDEGR